MNRAIKYRIYPTTEQEIKFQNTFGCCRKVYNLMLDDKIKSYEKTKTFGKQSIGVHPGIVAGRLQHEGILLPNRCSKFKEKYDIKINHTA